MDSPWAEAFSSSSAPICAWPSRARSSRSRRPSAGYSAATTMGSWPGCLTRSPPRWRSELGSPRLERGQAFADVDRVTNLALDPVDLLVDPVNPGVDPADLSQELAFHIAELLIDPVDLLVQALNVRPYGVKLAGDLVERR